MYSQAPVTQGFAATPLTELTEHLFLQHKGADLGLFSRAVFTCPPGGLAVLLLLLLSLLRLLLLSLLRRFRVASGAPGADITAFLERDKS
jgi:hypothetical protein